MASIGGSSTKAFGAGVNHTQADGRNNFANSITLDGDAGSGDQGLADTSARWNAAAGGGFTPHSVLQSVMPSGNGMSAEDAARQLPGGGPALPSPNGSGQDTYEQSALLSRLYGAD